MVPLECDRFADSQEAVEHEGVQGPVAVTQVQSLVLGTELELRVPDSIAEAPQVREEQR